MWESDEGKTVSYWQASKDGPTTNSLYAGAEADVCIIGGGIAGLTAAYLLSKAGRSVIVIDDGPIGGGETARTTAHLSWAIDDRIYRIAKWHGNEKARLAVEAHAAAVQLIEQVVSDENIDCDFSRLDGYLFEAEDGEDDLDRELDAAHLLGFHQVEMLDGLAVRGFKARRAIRFPGQGQFHILKYLSGLAKAIERNGGRLFSNTRAMEWKDEDAPGVKLQNSGSVRPRAR